MTEVDYYEKVRLKLRLGPLYASNNKKVLDLMKILWNEEEIKILSHFKSADQANSLKELSQKTGKSKQELKDLLRIPLRKATISRVGTKYYLLPLLPGVFEQYFIRQRDTKENLIKVAEIYRYLFKNFLPSFFHETNFKLFRPRLPLGAKEKLIEIDHSLDVQQQVLSFELMEEVIEKNDIFAVVPCQCRIIGDLTGEPCKVAPAELGCFLTGAIAEMAIKGGAPKLTKEQAIKFLEKTEKAGLIHSCVADTTVESSLFICNCCSCHCGVIMSSKEHRNGGTIPSNYLPRWNHELCTYCDICVKKCQMGAIYHKWPELPDKSDQHMSIKEGFCLGCGACAVNCPSGAIKMVKVRDSIPKEKHKIGNRTFLEILM